MEASHNSAFYGTDRAAGMAIYKHVGKAFWLLGLLSRMSQQIGPQWDGTNEVLVSGGQPLSDAYLAGLLAEFLDVKPQTIARWRLKLRGAGILEWLIKPGCGRVFILKPVKEPVVAASGQIVTLPSIGAKVVQPPDEARQWEQ